MPFSLPQVDDGVVELVSVDNVVAGRMEIWIVDDTCEEMDMDNEGAY